MEQSPQKRSVFEVKKRRQTTSRSEQSPQKRSVFEVGKLHLLAGELGDIGGGKQELEVVVPVCFLAQIHETLGAARQRLGYGTEAFFPKELGVSVHFLSFSQKYIWQREMRIRQYLRKWDGTEAIAPSWAMSSLWAATQRLKALLPLRERFTGVRESLKWLL